MKQKNYSFSFLLSFVFFALLLPVALPLTTNAQQVTGFTLVNASNSTDIQSLKNGDVVNLATAPSLNIRANTSPATIGSVVFTLTGQQTATLTETVAPYALFGDVGGIYNSWLPAAGSYTLKAVPYTGSKGTGTAGTSMTITFTIVDKSSNTSPITSFTLVNATTDQDIQTITNGDVFNLATLPSKNLNIRANTLTTVGSVVFNLSGQQVRNFTEGLPPYALFGDIVGDYKNWTPAVGNYNLKATPYSAGGGTGNAGTALTISFSFKDQPSGAAAIMFNQASESAEVEQGKTKSLGEYISTSNNNPVNAKLTAIDDAGRTPSWLSVNGKILNGISYTTGSEISFDFDANNLSIGTYYATVTASANGYNSGVLNIKFTVTSGTSGTLANIRVNFQDSATATPSGWLRDYGQAFGARTSTSQGSGNVYGWIKRSDNSPLNLTKNGRKRTSPSDILLATLVHMQANDIASFTGTRIEGAWQAKVANGTYEVTVSVGDGSQIDSKHSINIEGVKAISQFIPTSTVMFKSATVIVSVSDGYLTVDGADGTNTKINWITIKPYTGNRPYVVTVNPESSSVNVNENSSISTSILKLPNDGINNATITSANVYLTENATGVLVSAKVNGTGGGDAITLVPAAPLKLATTYRFTITAGVKDLGGFSFVPYSSTFTTTSTSSSGTTAAQFDKINLPNAVGQHSSLTIGPDKKLYALTIDGIIKRFTINTDGTLGTPELLYSLQDAYGVRTPRLAIGLAFDPAATASNLILWVTHSTFVFVNGPDWDGKLTRLSGANLGTVQDVLINLPRSQKDHVTNSIAFGPDKALYFTQGSTSAMGRADQTWGNRNEHLLSGAVLRLDVSKLGTLPLNVKTSDGGGTYNPYATNAPLTIYASGVRNAYDLVWHSNGNLYTPTNGSAAGGNTPASVSGTLRTNGTTYSGPSVPALTNVQQTQKDWLFRIVKGGYYGHPNPIRGEYVMNGGNPTSGIDPAEVPAYPLGTKPDANWRGYAYDFQNNASPDGAIEYKSKTFNGALKGKLLVVRYSQHDDIISLTPGGTNKDIISATEGYSIPGFSGFSDPLDLTEDTTKGNIYVSEYGGNGRIVLLRPRISSRELPPSANSYVVEQSTIKAYPNPSNRGPVTVLLPRKFEGEISYTLVSLSGKTLTSGKLTLRTPASNLIFDFSREMMASGLYYLYLENKGQKAEVQLMRSK